MIDRKKKKYVRNRMGENRVERNGVHRSRWEIKLKCESLIQGKYRRNRKKSYHCVFLLIFWREIKMFGIHAFFFYFFPHVFLSYHALGKLVWYLGSKFSKDCLEFEDFGIKICIVVIKTDVTFLFLSLRFLGEKKWR